MTRPFGFSTGSLDPHNPAEAIARAIRLGTRAIELSALRVDELTAISRAKREIDLSSFVWISLHAPSRYTAEIESRIADELSEISAGEHPVVVHPDAIHDFRLWTRFGKRLLIENMDKRKLRGRLAKDFFSYFEALPEARLCLDVAHVRQVDASFVEGYKFLREFGDRLAEIHISEISSDSRHSRLSMHDSFLREFLTLVPNDIPVIIESVLNGTTAEAELSSVEKLFAPVSAQRTSAG
jgi:sugar phosphate isomerase/epimerase